MKSILKLSFILFLTSCASYNYREYDKRKKNTIQIKADNLTDFRVVYNAKDVEVTNAHNGVAEAYPHKLKNKNISFLLVHQNYDTVKIEAKRVVRKKALIKDVALGVFTFGIPLIVDAFRSDFYRISPKTQEFEVHFEYKQVFMLAEYIRIKNSPKPSVFSYWLSTYPNSNIYHDVLDHKDSLELDLAIAEESEKAIDYYIQSHQQSNFLAAAKKIKNEMIEARILFNEVKKENTVVAYERFLKKYPKSLHNTEAHRLLVTRAISEAKEKNTLEAILRSNSDYLVTYENYLTPVDIKNKTTDISQKVDNLLIKQLKNSKANKYEAYSLFWQTYYSTINENRNIKSLPQSLKKNELIADLLIRKLNSLKTAKAQSEFLVKAKSDFPNLNGFLSNDFSMVELIVRLALNFNGTIELKEQQFLDKYLTNCYEGDVLKNLTGFTYQYQNYNQTYLDGNIEQITLQNGEISRIVISNQSKKIIDAEFGLNRQRSSMKAKKISFYLDGKLVKTNFSDLDNNSYSYEYKDRKNLTLLDLENRVKEADKVMANKNFDRALEMYQSCYDNTFPKTLSLNKRIEKSMNKAQIKKAAYYEKIENERLAEERNKGLLTSGNFDKELEKVCYEVVAAIMLKDYTGKSSKNIEEETKKNLEKMLGHKLNKAEVNYFDKFMKKIIERQKRVQKFMNINRNASRTCKCCNKSFKGSGWSWDKDKYRTFSNSVYPDYCTKRCAVECKGY